MMPTVGRVVLCMWPRLTDGALVPCAALITHVWSANVVNVHVFTGDGQSFPVSSAWLDESPTPSRGTWHWPPR